MANHFDTLRAERSKIAHKLAVDQVYPRIFGDGYDIEYVAYDKNNQEERYRMLDCHLGIDAVVSLSIKTPYPERKMIITAQERFRNNEFQKYQDITITDGNNFTGSLCESTKLMAHLLIYGYVDYELQCITDAIAVNIEILVSAIHKRLIIPKRNDGNRNEQPFLSVPFDDLYRIKAVRWHMANEEKFEIKDLLLSLHTLINDRMDEVDSRIFKLEQMFTKKRSQKTTNKDSSGNVIQAEDLFGIRP